MRISFNSDSRLWVTSQMLVGHSRTPGESATNDTDYTERDPDSPEEKRHRKAPVNNVSELLVPLLGFSERFASSDENERVIPAVKSI